MKAITKKATVISSSLHRSVTGLILTLGVVLSGCGQVTDLVDSTTAASGTFSHVYTNVLSGNCLQCHDGTSTADNGNVDFSTKAKAYESLIGKTVTGPSTIGICGGVPLITAGEPANSYFAAVLIAEYSNQNGIAGDADCDPFPTHLEGLGGTNLSAAEETSIKDWITAGALNN